MRLAEFEPLAEEEVVVVVVVVVDKALLAASAACIAAIAPSGRTSCPVESNPMISIPTDDVRPDSSSCL